MPKKQPESPNRPAATEPPDPLAPVVQVEFESAPCALETSDAAWLDGELR